MLFMHFFEEITDGSNHMVTSPHSTPYSFDLMMYCLVISLLAGGNIMTWNSEFIWYYIVNCSHFMIHSSIENFVIPAKTSTYSAKILYS